MSDRKYTIALFAAIAMNIVAVIGLTRLYDSAPPQAIALTIVVGTIAFLAMYATMPKIRSGFDAISTEQLVLAHSVRAPIGASFLVFASESMLPSTFATRAGIGDIAISFAGVIAVMLCVRLTASRSRLVYLAWNVLGVIDLLVAVGTGMTLALTLPGSMDWIARLPLLVVPMIVLPFLFGTHVLMLRRLVRSSAAPEAR